MPATIATIIGLNLAGATTTAATLGIVGAVAGGEALYKQTKKAGKRKFPGITEMPEMPEVPGLTVEEIEAQEMGWQQILKRARGRRATILTEPMLAQIQPYTQRATLLAG